MRKMVLAALALVAVILSSASVGEESAARADPPAEALALIDHNAYCNSLATHQEPNGAAQLDAKRLYFKCDAIAQDEAALRQEYQSDPRVLKELEGSTLPTDVDNLIHRRVGCDRLKNPSHESEAVRLYLKCDSVAKDEAALRRKI